MNNSLTFCQMSLARASELRHDKNWLMSKLVAKDSLYCYYWRGKYLFHQQQLLLWSRHTVKGCAEEIQEIFFAKANDEQFVTIFLGLQQETAIFARDLSEISEQVITKLLTSIELEQLDWLDFRASLALLSSEQASLLGYAKALLHWHRSALYCGYCGAKTKLEDGGHRRLCQSNECAKEHFPRTDPVVIMLVEYQNPNGENLCLLGEHQRTPAQVYSTLAGFVDPGESLEQAVARECMEEAGVAVNEVNYLASQPWPFPQSLMLGFIARTSSKHLQVDEKELRSAGWFSAKQIMSFANWGSDVAGPKLPRHESIARTLIDTWCQQQLNSQYQA